LLEQLNIAALGSTIVASSQPCDETVTAFSAVYWDASTPTFRPAIAAIAPLSSGEVLAAPSALSVGVVTKKYGPNTCDIALYGSIKLTAVELAILINNETPTAGLLYLSPLIDGKLTSARPTAAIAVGVLIGPANGCTTDYRLLLGAGCCSDSLLRGSLREYQLAAVPAGGHVPPALHGTHTILSPDSNLPGWLPAGHAVFAGLAPVGAVFGYNISQDVALQSAWPPSGKKVRLEFYSESDIGIVGLKQIPESYYIVDNTTIWWTTACYTQVPWNYLLNTTVVPPAPGTCDITTPSQLVLSFERSVLDSSSRVVTKLSDSSDGLITFVNSAGIAATRGDLKAKLNAATAITSSAAFGSTVVKTVGPGFQFTRGIVVEGLRSTTGNLTITGSTSRLLDPAQAESVSNYRIQQGVLNLAVANSEFGVDLSPALVRLGDSLQRNFNGISYIGFASGITSSVTCRFDIPNGELGTKQLIPYVVMFGRAAGPFSAMTATYTIIKAPPLPSGPQVIPGLTLPLTFDVVTPSTGLATNSAISVTAGSIQLYSGDTVYITFTREQAAIPAFANDIGFIRIGAALKPFA